MPSVADLLKQAAQAPECRDANSKSNQGPMAGHECETPVAGKPAPPAEEGPKKAGYQ